MSVRISKKYGLNASLQVCPICGKDMGIIMFGTSYKDEKGKVAQAPKQISVPGQICDSCKDVIENQHGVFFIEVKDGEGEKHSKNPYRTGRITAITEDAVKNIGITNYQSVNYIEETLFNHLFKEALQK